MSSFCMPLNAIASGKCAEVDKLEGGESLGKKLMEMGMCRGALIEIVKNDAGPLIIKIGQTKIVLGRGMAQKVVVKEVK